MSADGILIETYEVPDPKYPGLSGDKAGAVDRNISYSYQPDWNPLRTLSTTNAPSHNIDGLLYVPTLTSDSTCNTTDFIPHNVTRRRNLPSGIPSYDLIAFAPWINTPCTFQFLDAASNDAGVKAFIFYQPDDSEQEAPETRSEVWSLQDGSAWKSNYFFPVYALPGRDGNEIMEQLSLYSGNMTDAPHGDKLVQYYHPSDYIRLVAVIDTEDHSDLPSLWVFLLAVLGILIFIIGATSAIMHWLQRRRRNRLRQRVIAGEVDLEALGIKRLSVPQEVLDKLPIYTYIPGSTPLPTSDPTNPFDKKTTTYPSSFGNQATCPICLDDYTPSSTQVRQLPCGHIYHPECIDVFLRENSSLCPLCKKSVLPKGYCPKNITNLMVRRARLAELRDSGRVPQGTSRGMGRGWGLFDALPTLMSVNGERRWREVQRPLPMTQTQTPTQSIVPQTPTMPATPTNQLSVPAPLASPMSPMSANSQSALLNVQPPLPVHRPGTVMYTPPAPSTVPSASSPSRREWARQRALALLGRRHVDDSSTVLGSEETEQATRQKGWKSVFHRVFPRGA